MERVVSTYRSIGVVFLIVLVGADGDLGQIPRYVREGGHPLFVLHTAGGGRGRKEGKGNKKSTHEKQLETGRKAIRGNLHFSFSP